MEDKNNIAESASPEGDVSDVKSTAVDSTMIAAIQFTPEQRELLKGSPLEDWSGIQIVEKSGQFIAEKI